MLTLDETLAVQSDLNRLCADRRLRTSEVFAPNAFYGIDRVLKHYARLPLWYSLKAVVPHGLVLKSGYIWEAERQVALPAVMYYPPYREASYIESTDKQVIPSAAPFVYVAKMLEAADRQQRTGTIFFPTHSTHHLTVQADFERCAERLMQLGPEHHPVRVCIYWRDFHLGHHLPFQKRGMQIISAGHMFDPAFLFRFYHLCSIHKYSTSNGLGSHLFYSVKAGCSYFHLEAGDAIYTATEKHHTRELAECPPNWASNLKVLFRDPLPTTSLEQWEVVDYYLGAAHLKTPAKLRRQLCSLEVLDKIGRWSVQRGRPSRPSVPTFLQRTIQRVEARTVRAKEWLLRLRPSSEWGGARDDPTISQRTCGAPKRPLGASAARER
jgi:hypothetical protein